MVIIVSSISAVALMSPGTQSTSVDSQLNVEALNKAQQVIESVQSLARKDFKLVVPSIATEVVGGTSYQKVVTVQTDPTNTGDYFTKKVTSTVSWGAQYGRSQQVALSSLVGNFQNVIGGDTCDSVLTGNWASPQITSRLLGQDILGDSAGAYAITDIDAYQKKLYVTVNQSSQTAGPNNAATAGGTTGTGSVTWNNPSFIAGSDNSRAATSLSSGNTTKYLKVQNFGFAIPTNATIIGIKVEVERSVSGSTSGGIKDAEIKIIKADGTISTNNKADTTTSWPVNNSEAYASYNPADLWGEQWSAAAINNANFGVAIAAAATASRTAQVDHVRITVTYIKEFYILDTTIPTAPTFIATLGSNTIGTGFNAVHVATSSAGYYAFVATNAGPGTGQLQVIGLTGTPTVLSTYAVSGVTGTGAQALGNSIYYRDGYVYIGLTKSATGPEFAVIDVHNPAAPSLLGSYTVGASVNSINVKGNYVYLTTTDNSRELIILNMSDLAHPALAASYDAPGTTNFGYGRALYTVGDTLYFGRTYDAVATASEFQILNISNPGATPPLLGQSNIGPNSSNPYGVYGVIIRDTLAFILTNASSGGQLKIMSINTPGSIGTPTSASVALPSSGGGVALDCEGNYLYAASVPATNKGSISIITAP